MRFLHCKTSRAWTSSRWTWKGQNWEYSRERKDCWADVRVPSLLRNWPIRALCRGDTAPRPSMIRLLRRATAGLRLRKMGSYGRVRERTSSAPIWWPSRMSAWRRQFRSSEPLEIEGGPTEPPEVLMPGNPQRWIALLGRRDGPTDGVADYCTHLGAALGLHDCELETVRVPWPERGWGAALADLRRRAEDWRGRWVLLQYTALGWSRRAFPLRFLQVLRVLRHNGARCVIVFHDVLPYGGSRMVDRLRRTCQLWVMRTAYRRTDRSVLPVSLDQVTWLPSRPTKAAFIPIGANLSPVAANPGNARASHGERTVAVYGVTGEPATLSEVRDISHVLKLARARVENL